MVISKNNQLGLMLWDNQVMVDYLTDIRISIEKESIRQKEMISKLENTISGKNEITEEDILEFEKSGSEVYNELIDRFKFHPENKGSEFYTIPHPNPYYYLILNGVEKCADLIKVKENFSCTAFNKIKDGQHVYLLGKDEFVRFLKFNNGIRVSYWNRKNKTAFELCFLLDKDLYYYPLEFIKEFHRIVRLMLFIECGDIEVTILENGRNNGKNKNSGKITNTSNNTVYVVDTSWNKLIIRTEGFAVRGHFRLQPCGHNMADRKLIWINSFEKEGYKRRPKAEIIN